VHGEEDSASSWIKNLAHRLIIELERSINNFFSFKLVKKCFRDWQGFNEKTSIRQQLGIVGLGPFDTNQDLLPWLDKSTVWDYLNGYVGGGSFHFESNHGTLMLFDNRMDPERAQ